MITLTVKQNEHDTDFVDIFSDTGMICTTNIDDLAEALRGVQEPRLSKWLYGVCHGEERGMALRLLEEER